VEDGTSPQSRGEWQDLHLSQRRVLLIEIVLDPIEEQLDSLLLITALCNTIGESRAARNATWWLLARDLCTLAYVPSPSWPTTPVLPPEAVKEKQHESRADKVAAEAPRAKPNVVYTFFILIVD
jgi:hypothetical protein